MLKACLALAFFGLVFVLPVQAFNWETATVRGRDYVSLHSFCLFYGLPYQVPNGNDRFTSRNAQHTLSMKIGSPDAWLVGEDGNVTVLPLARLISDDRAATEDEQPDQQRAPAAVAITDRSCRQQQRRERQRVGGDDPFQLTLAGVSAPRDRRQRDIERCHRRHHGGESETDHCRHDTVVIARR